MGSPNQDEAQGTWNRSQAATLKRNVITGATTLTTAQSGSLCLWNSATGYTFTLPTITANDVGTWFEFLCTITNTATACKVITASASTYIIGMPLTYIANTTPAANPGPKGFAFNGSSNIACVMGGTDTTAGGVAGTFIRLVATTTAQWHISGTICAAGTIVTAASDT